MSLDVTFGTPGTGPAPPLPPGLAGAVVVGPPANDPVTLFAALLATVAQTTPAPAAAGKPAVLPPTETETPTEPHRRPERPTDDPTNNPTQTAAPDATLTTLLMAMALPPPAPTIPNQPPPKAPETKGVGGAPGTTETTTRPTTREAMDTVPPPAPSARSVKADGPGSELLPLSSTTTQTAAPAEPGATPSSVTPFMAQAPLPLASVPVLNATAPETGVMPQVVSVTPRAMTVTPPVVLDGAPPIVTPAPGRVSPQPSVQAPSASLPMTPPAPVSVVLTVAPAPVGAPLPIHFHVNEVRPEITLTTPAVPVTVAGSEVAATAALPALAVPPVSVPQSTVVAVTVPDVTQSAVPSALAPPAARPEPSPTRAMPLAEAPPTVVPAVAPKAEAQAAPAPLPAVTPAPSPVTPPQAAFSVQATLQNRAAPANNTGTPPLKVKAQETRPSLPATVNVRGQAAKDEGAAASSPAQNQQSATVRADAPSAQNFVRLPATNSEEKSERPAAAPNGAEALPTAPAAATLTTPAPQGMTPTLTHADRALVMQQISDGAREMRPQPAPGGAREMTLHLHPHDWGQIKLSVRMTPETNADGTPGTAVIAHIVADNPVVKAALETHTAELRHALHEAGLNLERLSVTVQAPSEGRQPDMNGQGDHRPFGQDTNAWAGQAAPQAGPDINTLGPSGNGAGFGGAFSSAFGDGRGGQTDYRPAPQTAAWADDAGEPEPTRTRIAPRPQAGRWDSRA